MAWVKTDKTGENQWVCYDPRRVSKGQVVKDNTLETSTGAMQRIARARPMFRFTEGEAYNNARHYGTVFVYSNPNVTNILQQLPRNQVVYTQQQL